MSQPCRLISWSMAFHSSGPRELNSPPTAENKLPFTALATCIDSTVQWVLKESLSLSDVQTFGLSREQHTDPVEAGLFAELMGPCCTEVIVWPEGLIECCNEVENCLPTTLVTQRVLTVFTALPKPPTEKKKKKILYLVSLLYKWKVDKNYVRWQYSLWRAGGAGGLGGRKRLQDMWLPLLAELFEHMFVISCHFTGVALNPAQQKYKWIKHVTSIDIL